MWEDFKDKMSKRIVNASLIIPILNEVKLDNGERLEKLIESIHAQDVMPLEVIFVDGGSYDGTAEKLAAEMYKTDNFVRVIRKEGNISFARNTGAKAAKGEVLIFTDVGTILPTNYVDVMYHSVANDAGKDTKIIGTAGAYEVDTDGLNVGQVLFNTTIIKPVKAFTKNFQPSGRSVAMLKDLYLEVGGYPEELNIGEDTEFNYRVEDEGYSFIVQDEAIVKWNIGGKSFMETFKIFVKKMFNYGKWDGRNPRFADRVNLLMAGIIIFPVFAIFYPVVLWLPVIYLLAYGVKLAWINKRFSYFPLYVFSGAVKRVVYSLGLIFGAFTSGRRT